MCNDTIGKYWLKNVHNLPGALLAMNHFDVYSSTKLDRVRLGYGIDRCSHIRYHCNSPPYNLTVGKLITVRSYLEYHDLRCSGHESNKYCSQPVEAVFRCCFFADRTRRLTYRPGHKEESYKGRNNGQGRLIENQVRYWAHSTSTSWNRKATSDKGVPGQSTSEYIRNR